RPPIPLALNLWYFRCRCPILDDISRLQRPKMSELLSFSDGLHLDPRRGKELLGPAGLVRPDRPAAGEAEPETIPGRASSSATPRGFHLALLGPGVAPARGFHLISAIRGAPALNRVPSLRGASWQHRTDPHTEQHRQSHHH